MKLSDKYLSIKENLIKGGFEGEIKWQASVRLEDLTEQKFLREYAWVVLASGMREQVIRKLWPDMIEAFGGFKSAKDMANPYNSAKYMTAAIAIFNHPKKLMAIQNIAEHIAAFGWDYHYQGIQAKGIYWLETYEYIGKVTKYHLAKNIGLQVAKPDRHLVRIAAATGFHKSWYKEHNSVQNMCRAISEATGDSIPVVDLVLWRYATINPDYLKEFEETDEGKAISEAARFIHWE